MVPDPDNKRRNRVFRLGHHGYPEMTFDPRCTDGAVLAQILKAGNAARRELERHGITGYCFMVRLCDDTMMLQLETRGPKWSALLPEDSDQGAGIPVLDGPRGPWHTARWLLLGSLLRSGTFDDSAAGTTAREAFEAELQELVPVMLATTSPALTSPT